MQNYPIISDKFIRNVKNRRYSLPMNLHRHPLYLLGKLGESFKSWSTIVRINTEDKSIDYEIQP